MGKKYDVSDHAMVRYLDRVMGFDVNTIYNMILTKETKYKLNSVNGTGIISIEGGFAVFKKFKCVTIKPSAQKDYMGHFTKVNKKRKLK